MERRATLKDLLFESVGICVLIEKDVSLLLVSFFRF